MSHKELFLNDQLRIMKCASYSCLVMCKLHLSGVSSRFALDCYLKCEIENRRQPKQQKGGRIARHVSFGRFQGTAQMLRESHTK